MHAATLLFVAAVLRFCGHKFEGGFLPSEIVSPISTWIANYLHLVRSRSIGTLKQSRVPIQL